MTLSDMKRFLAYLILSAALVLSPEFLRAQTDFSLFMRCDSLQTPEFFSPGGNEYRTVGHHGPAVENSHSAFRIYFNNSGSIDVYSKNGRGMELSKYHWYPTEEDRQTGAGCDEYKVGSTVGLGGIALWDGEKEVKLVATRGRSATAGKTKKGAFIEMKAFGIAYCGDSVDIAIRVDVFDKDRRARVTARELSGKKVSFLTGVNFHPGEETFIGDGFLCVWGRHPADVSQSPVPIGAGLFFGKGAFLPAERTDNLLRIVSKPTSSIRTQIVSASTKEAELNNCKRFWNYMGVPAATDNASGNKKKKSNK